MKARSWTQAGFFVLLGLSSGLLISDLTAVRTVEAAGGSSSFNEEFRIVTGHRTDTNSDVVWLLDYRAGKLVCLGLGSQGGRMTEICDLDLMEQFELSGRQKPKFMLVTGQHPTLAMDVCYVAEITKGQLLCVAPPFAQQGGGRNRQQIGTQAAVIGRYQFTKETTRR